jgi:hypothetical protein
MDEDYTDQFAFDDNTSIEDAIAALDNATLDADDEDLSDDIEDDGADATEDEDDVETDDSDEDPEEGSDDEDEDDSDEDTDEDDSEDAPKAIEADDDAEVAVIVDGKEHRVSVKDLKRLYGQETALTQKAQALASQRRLIEAQGLFYAKTLQDRHSKAVAQAQKYANVDLFRASRELEPDEFDALRSAKENAESEVIALEREGNEFITSAQQTKANLLREQARESLKVLSAAIPDWSDDLYGKIRTYAVSQGMDVDSVNEIVDPGAIQMIHKAMRFDEAQKKSPSVKKKIAKAPSKVVKKGETQTTTKSSGLKAQRQKALMSGDIDAIADLMDAMSAQ